MIIRIPNINNDVIDTDIFKQEIIDYCEKAIPNSDKDKYLKDKFDIIYEVIAPLVKEDFQKGVLVSPEYLELDLLKNFILGKINLINAQTPNFKENPTSNDSNEKIDYIVIDRVKYLSKPQKDEKNHNMFIWNKSEKSLIEMFKKLTDSKNGFIDEKSLKNISQHFSLPNNPIYNFKSEESTKIKWMKCQTHLMWFIKNLNKEIISIEKGKLHVLTALHFCGKNNKVFLPHHLDTALSNIKHIDEEYIKSMKANEEYEKLRYIITKISN